MRSLTKIMTVSEVIEKINSNENGIYAIEQEVGTGQINSLKEASDDEITVRCSLMNLESLRELRKLGGTDKQVIILDEFDRASLHVKEELIKSLDEYKDSIVILIRETIIQSIRNSTVETHNLCYWKTFTER